MGLHEIARRTILTNFNEKEQSIALLKQSLTEIKTLIKEGADVNALEDGKTPLATLFDRDEVQVGYIFQQR